MVMGGICRLLSNEEDSDGSGFTSEITGDVSIDIFVTRLLHQDAWLIYNALMATVPHYMITHSISPGDISNRKHRLIRMQNLAR